MVNNKRILALEMDNELFEQLDDYVRSKGLSKKQYVAEVIKTDLEERLRQEQKINDIKNFGSKNWEREEVENAIEDFIKQNGRTPGQKEFRNENGLPSYGAAARVLECSPSQYANQKMLEMFNMEQGEEMSGQMMMGI